MRTGTAVKPFAGAGCFATACVGATTLGGATNFVTVFVGKAGFGTVGFGPTYAGATDFGAASICAGAARAGTTGVGAI